LILNNTYAYHPWLVTIKIVRLVEKKALMKREFVTFKNLGLKLTLFQGYFFKKKFSFSHPSLSLRVTMPSLHLHHPI
jgi:hypothetical protein